MKKRKETPANVAIQTFGGIHETARALAEETGDTVHFTTVSKWRHRSGNVPPRWHGPLIRAAKKRGKTLTLEQLMYQE